MAAGASMVGGAVAVGVAAVCAVGPARGVQGGGRFARRHCTWYRRCTSDTCCWYCCRRRCGRSADPPSPPRCCRRCRRCSTSCSLMPRRHRRRCRRCCHRCRLAAASFSFSFLLVSVAVVVVVVGAAARTAQRSPRVLPARPSLDEW